MMVQDFIHIKNEDGEDAIRRYVHHFLYELKIGIVIFVTGGTGLKTGTGKSVTAIRLGQIVNPDITVDDVCVTNSEFMHRLQYVRNSKKVGQVIIMDEAELMLSSNEYWNNKNKAIADALSIARYLRACIIIVTPSFFWVDKRVRTLATHWCYPVLSVGENQKPQVHLYFYRLRTDMFGEQIYFKKLRFYLEPSEKNQHGKLMVVNRILVRELKGALRDAYELKANAFKSGHHDMLTKQIEESEKKLISEMKEKVKTKAEFVQELLNDPEIIEAIPKRGRNDFLLPLVSEKLNVGRTDAAIFASLVRWRHGHANKNATAGSDDGNV